MPALPLLGNENRPGVGIPEAVNFYSAFNFNGSACIARRLAFFNREPAAPKLWSGSDAGFCCR